MGINLPIKRVVFLNLYKYEGTSTRSLRSEEVNQDLEATLRTWKIVEPSEGF